MGQEAERSQRHASGRGGEGVEKMTTTPAWLLLSLASMALVGTADLILRRATLRGVSPGSFLAVVAFYR
jgi:hypothetical protein